MTSTQHANGVASVEMTSVPEHVDFSPMNTAPLSRPAAAVNGSAPAAALNGTPLKPITARKGSVAAPEGNMELRFESLSYTVVVKDSDAPKSRNPFKAKPTKEKDILKNVSGVFKPGRMCAIMGASGAGKTSLLQVISGEAKTGVVTGELLINGQPVEPTHVKSLSGLVFQDDLILQTMTVREALTMAAILRLPAAMSMDERLSRVEEVIQMLKLEKSADVVVGDSEVKGISGGERKRLSVGMELINNPYLLFLDEFSSGLDTFTARKVGEILKELAQSGRTIVSTIHQPSAELFFMFDDLLLLAEGQTLYFGPTTGVISYFERLGHKIPAYTNPIDWIFMNVLSVFVDTPFPGHGEDGPLEPAKERIARISKAWPSTPEYQALQQQLVARPSAHADGISSIALKSRRSFWVQLWYLSQRTSKNVWRNKLVLQAKAAQTVVFGLLIGLTYFNLPSKPPSTFIQNYSGVLFFLIVNVVMMNAMSILNVFGEEKSVFRRESGSGYYGVAAFFFSKIMIELPTAVFFGWTMATVIYWMVYLPANAATYFVSMVIIAITGMVGSLLGIALASMFDSLNVALAVTPMILLPLMLFSGLFVNSSTIPPYFDWIKYLSPMKWGFEALIKEIVPAFAAPLGLDDGLSVGALIGILAAFVFGLLVLSYLGLWRVTVASVKRAKWVDVSTGKARTAKGATAKKEIQEAAVKASGNVENLV